MPVFELEESALPDPVSGGERKTYEPIEDGTVVEAEIGGIEVRPHPFFKDKETGEPEIKVNWEFNFELNGQKRKIWGETPTTFTTHPDCKLRNWVQQALGGGELPAGFKANTDNLTGNKVRIVIEYREWNDKQTGAKKWKNEVRDVMYSKSPAAGPSFLEEPF